MLKTASRVVRLEVHWNPNTMSGGRFCATSLFLSRAHCGDASNYRPFPAGWASTSRRSSPNSAPVRWLTPNWGSFSGDLGLAYRICLWSRLANRVTRSSAPILSKPVMNSTRPPVKLVDPCAGGRSLMVDFAGRSSDVRNPQFGALRIKDAIVDQHRAKRACSA